MTSASVVANYLPSNYRIVAQADNAVLVAGEDDHGWTADKYVIPRLGSGMIRAEEIGNEDPDSSVPILAWLTEHGNIDLVWQDESYAMTAIEDTRPKPEHMTIPPLRVQVIADSSGKWSGNALTFDDLDEAVSYAKDLFMRWTSTTDWRVIDAEDVVIRSRGDAA